MKIITIIQKILKSLGIVSRAVSWFFFGPNRKKLAKIWVTYKTGGIGLCWNRAVEYFATDRFLYNPDSNQLSTQQSSYVFTNCLNKPMISIVVPVYKVADKWLEKCINSVYCQHYKDWELILVDDASASRQLTELMSSWALKDERIKTYSLERNLGIAGATNFCIKQAKGKFIGFLDHDDELTPDALTWIIWAINEYPQACWFYSDEDKISGDGHIHSPNFKPDFSPELLLGNMYTCHFRVYSTAVLSKVGGLREGFDGSQDHDLALRLSEIVPKEKIIHIPRVLYHWREIPGSAAMGIEAKPKAPSAGRKAVAEALKRRNIKGHVASHKLCPTLYQIILKPTKFPKVSIIIPTKNSLLLLKRCLESLRKCTDYPNYEIILVDNQSSDASFFKYIEEERLKKGLKVIKYNKPFNHSDINNIAVKSTDSEFVVFMNNDIEIISDDWLDQLVASINIEDDIGAVGCLLFFPNDKTQHGGIVLGLNGVAGHSHKYVHGETLGYCCRLQSLQEFSGVTTAMSIFRRSAFEAAGGFSSDRYPTSFNDVDLCLRLREHGFRCIYNPMVRAIHRESQTRFVPKDELIYRKRLMNDYSEILGNDPFYNPNLALDNEQFFGFRPFPVEEQIPELANLPEDYRDGTDSV